MKYEPDQYFIIKDSYAKDLEIFNLVKVVNANLYNLELSSCIECLANESESPSLYYIPEDQVERVLTEDELEIAKLLFNKEFNMLNKHYDIWSKR